MKKICAFVLALSVLFLTSCGRPQEKWEDIARNELSQYTTGNNVALVYQDEKFYLNSFTLDIDNISEGEYCYHSYYLDGHILYFSTATKHSFDSYTVTLYSCDLINGSLSVVFCRDKYDMGHTYVTENKFYIYHYLDSSISDADITVVDLYNIDTGEYSRVDNGPTASLEKFKVNDEKQVKYDVELVNSKNGKYFRITDKDTGVIKTVDKDFMLKTSYVSMFSNHGYSPQIIDVVDEHILIAFDLSFGTFIAYNYTCVVFEYDFENETVEYQLLAFPYDYVSLKFLYVE